MDENANKKYQEIIDKYAADMGQASTPPSQIALSPSEVKPMISERSAVVSPAIVSESTPVFIKFLFFISLLVFLGVLSAIGYNFYRSMSGSSPVVALPTALPTQPVLGETCLLNDTNYQVDESFPSADGCNTCSCTKDLTITCTDKACDAFTPQPTGKTVASPTSKINPITTTTTTTTTKTDPLSIATKYLDAYVTADWATTKELSADKNFDEKIAAGYELVSYKIISSKYDSDKNYFHVYLNLTDKNGKTFKVVPPNTPLSILMTYSDGKWKALTWYFFQ
ncbi:hypothetical protein KBC75_02925 [Candidatus Shapirobacteria bacterium]|nr:hypothetical protein [Candidatus Shapirobacteria bacterium]